MCGRDSLAGYPYLFFNEWVTNIDDVSGTVCVKECPKTSGVSVSCFSNSQIPQCDDIDAYPSVRVVHRFCFPNAHEEALKILGGTAASVITTGTTSSTDAKNNAKALSKQTNAAVMTSSWDTMYEDIKEAWLPIMICIFICFILCYLYVWLMEFCAWPLIIVTIAAMYVMIFLFGWECWTRYKNFDETDNHNKLDSGNGYYWTAIITWILLAFSF